MSCACTYSEQEQLLLDTIAGKSNPYAEKHPRLYRLVAAFEGKKPHIDVERALLFTESMKQTEGELLVLRWAKALKHMTVYIDDDQLIAGRCGQQGARYGILYPELDGDYQASALKELPGHEASPFDVNAEDARAVEEIITPYWKDKTMAVQWGHYVSKEEWNRGQFGVPSSGLCRQGRLHLPLHLLRNGLQSFQPAVVPGLGTPVQAGLQGHP